MYRVIYWFALLCSVSLFFAGCSKSPKPHAKQTVTKDSLDAVAYDEKNYRVDEKAKIEIGNASYYATCMSGRRTASGEICNLGLHTAAHRTLPFGTMIRVTMLQNGKSVIAKVNDRGPHSKGRVVDLSLAAARKIGMIRAGIAKVKVEKLKELQ
ncbi:MAG: septal ring lytic transglycosylase RlpA family protein [Sulfurovum sp.]|nr:septal ring lytic transglycosylase RlpA family protein [Sulfurovum sp.]